MHSISGVVLLTDRRVARGSLVDVVAAAVAGGVRWVVLREKDLPRAERLALAAELRPILVEAGGTLVVAGPDPLLADQDRDPAGAGHADDRGTGICRADAAGRLGAAGTATEIRTPIAIHLSAAGPYPPPAADLVGRSCHDEAELHRLSSEDYVTLSPVFPTRTKPGHGPPLLPEGLAGLIRRSPVPALALGGIETPAQVRACIQAGATGVAVLGTMMRATDPHLTASTLVEAFRQAATSNPRTPPPPASPPPPVNPPPLPKREPAQLRTARPTTGLRPTVPTQGSSLTARSGHGRPQPPQ
ncbi:thiamine phosphate synthase [Micromonospora sp. Llam7]|nr:thiamine phosphate synthase [Micromonospora tarapacensis]